MRKREKRWTKGIALAAALALAVAGITACGSSGSQEAASTQAEASASSSDGYTFKYVVNNLGDVITADIAIARGSFEKAGVSVENVGVAGGGAVAIEEVSGGDADISNAAIPAYINAVTAGSKIKVVYGGPAIAHADDPGYQILIAKDSDIKSPEDLEGKTVALGARGAMWEFTVRLYMENAGLDADSVNYLTVPVTQHEQVLKSGQVDAVVDGSPIADQIKEDGVGKTLSSLYEVLGDDASYGWGYIVNTDVIQEHSDELKKVVEVLEETDEWVEENPEEAREIAAKVLAERDQDESLAKYWHPFHLVNHGLWTDEHVDFWIDYLKKEGKIDEDVSLTPSDIYTNEYNPYNGK